MHTYFLGSEEVRAYLLDFLRRLRTLDRFPTVWCPVTKSGDSLLQALVQVVHVEQPDFLDQVQVLGVEVTEGRIAFVGGDPEQLVPNRSILLLDGSIHSGQMMSRCAAKLREYSPSALATYALVMKRCSVFVPTFWGLMIDECDRSYFLLDAIPNNRLNAGPNRTQPLVHLEKLSPSHLQTPSVQSNVPSIDRITWADRHFQMQTAGSGTATYLLHQMQDVVGFLTIHFSESDVLSIDEVVVAESFQGSGFGGVLLRFAESVARHAGCSSLRLNAIFGRVPTYERFGCRAIPGRSILRIDKEEYQPMEKKLLYHHEPL